MNSLSKTSKSQEVILEPMYRLPCIIVITGIPILLTPLPARVKLYVCALPVEVSVIVTLKDES